MSCPRRTLRRMANRLHSPTLPLPTGTTIDVLTPALVRLSVPLPEPNLPRALDATTIQCGFVAAAQAATLLRRLC